MSRSWARSRRRQIEETPLPNQRITFLPLLNAANRPAINQGDVFMNEDLFTTNGAGRRQAWFEVDGSTGNDSWGRQTIFSNIPRSAVLEMACSTNAFSAEYGGSTGSVVNIVTKTGGNDFHGEVMELWRPAETSKPRLPDSLLPTLPAATTSPATRSDKAIVSLSGPIGSSGAHAFLRGRRIEPRRSRLACYIASRARSLRRATIAAGSDSFASTTASTTRTTCSSAATSDGFHDTNPNGTVGGNNLPSVDRVFRRRTYSEEFGETAVLSPTLLNNLRLQFQLASPITEFDPVIYGTQYSVPISDRRHVYFRNLAIGAADEPAVPVQ